MTRIDFYILSTSSADDRIRMVCKLIDKATAQGQRVFVHSNDRPLLESLHTSLGDFSSERLITHQLVDENASIRDSITDENRVYEEFEQVTLSSSDPARTDAVLINLSSSVPVFFSRFERTLEVVDRQELIRLEGRNRYRFYQERGYPLQHHNL